MSLIPASFLFRYTFSSIRVEGLPRSKTPILQLPQGAGVPWPSGLNGENSFTSLGLAWNDAGFAAEFTIQLPQTGPARGKAGNTGSQTVIGILLDTRDTQAQHRASRFCHHFQLNVMIDKKGNGKVTAKQIPIARAREESPITDEENLLTEFDIQSEKFRVSLWIPADSLNGYSPVVGARLGMMAYVLDQTQGEQTFNVSTEFPIDSDPSLWSSIELIEG